jgi:hypothetical protein
MHPYYPIPRVQNAELYTRYRALTLPSVIFPAGSRRINNWIKWSRSAPQVLVIAEEFVLCIFLDLFLQA